MRGFNILYILKLFYIFYGFFDTYTRAERAVQIPAAMLIHIARYNSDVLDIRVSTNWHGGLAMVNMVLIKPQNPRGAHNSEYT